MSWINLVKIYCKYTINTNWNKCKLKSVFGIWGNISDLFVITAFAAMPFLKRTWWWWRWWIIFVIWLTDKRRLPYFQPGPLSEILTISNLRHTASRIWTCAESEFRLCWVKLCSSDKPSLKIYSLLSTHKFAK